MRLLPRVNAGRIVLLDRPDLLRELRGLDRRRGLAGRDRIDHGPGGHDDVANAAAGALLLAAERAAQPFTFGQLGGNLNVMDPDGTVRSLREMPEELGAAAPAPDKHSFNGAIRPGEALLPGEF